MRLINALKTYGLFGFVIRFLKKATYRIFAFFDKWDNKLDKKRLIKMRKKKQVKYDQINELVNNPKYKHIFVFYPYTEWNLPIFQRPQQIALAMTQNRDDILYFYCTANYVYDKVDVIEKVNDNLYLCNDYEYLIGLPTDKRILHLYSTDIVSEVLDVKEALGRKDKVLYEYIDEIHEDITQGIPKSFFKKHDFIFQNEDCYIVATADKLYNDVKKVRNKNFVLATNGVTVEDFIKNENDEIPTEIAELKKKYKKIICYYGALAIWFDYKLLKEAAFAHPDYAFILIGMEYDEAFKRSRVTDVENIYYLGKKNYTELHKYSSNVDLLTIPFLINDITESTSPVKLFEYMATNIPILTTNMKECRKYKSVITADDHDDYINKIDSTIELINDKKYLATETKEAEANTWAKKADTIINLLEGKEK